jgi:hypothetical protein
MVDRTNHGLFPRLKREIKAKGVCVLLLWDQRAVERKLQITHCNWGAGKAPP